MPSLLLISLVLSRWRARVRDQRGTELIQVAVVTAGLAAAALAVVYLISTIATGTVQNTPTR